MSKLMIAVLAVSALVSGCSNLCDRVESSSESLATKFKPCETATFTLTPTGDTSTCEQNLEKCTEQDKEKMSEYFDCTDAISTCEKGKESDWMGRVAECANKLNTISNACAVTR